MVHFDIDIASESRARLASRWCRSLDATLIGVGARAPRPPLTYGGMIVDPNVAEDRRQEFARDLTELGDRFRQVAHFSPKVEWRSVMGIPDEVVPRESRCQRFHCWARP